MDVRRVARPVLRDLAQSCQELVNLVVMDQGQVVNVEQSVAPARQVKNFVWVGLRMPPHCTAAGKVLMASLEVEELEQILADELVSYTPHTITDVVELRQELANVRKRGYATAREGWSKG